MSTILGSAYVRVRPDTTGFGSSLNSGVSGALKNMAGLVTSALAGIGVAAAAKSIVDIGRTYQDQLNNLQAVSGATAAQMSLVSQRAKELGSDTSLTATSAADAAIAMTELAKGGLSVDEAMRAARGTLQLASAAGVDAAAAASIQSAALNAFNLEADQSGRVADVLANAANAAAGEITDFGQAMQAGAAVAAATGISIEDTAAILGILANNGIAGSDAGTLLKSALLALQSPSNAAQDAMEDLGLTAYDAAGNFVGLESIFGQLSEAQGRMTDQAYAAATSTLFGSDAARLAGIAGREGAEGFAVMAAAMAQGGSAAEVAAAKAKGVTGAIEAFQSQLETVQINVFEAVAPAVENTLRTVGTAFETLSEQVPNLWAAFSDADAQGIAEVLDNIFGNTGEHVDTFRAAAQEFLPVWDTLAASFGNALDIARDLGPVIGVVLGTQLRIVWEVIKLLAPAIEKVTGFLADNQWAVLSLVGAYVALKAVTSAHAAALAVQASGGMVKWIRQTKLITSVTRTWTAVQWLLNTAIGANPFVRIATLLVALGASLYLAYQKSETFRNVVQTAFRAVGDAGIWLWENALKPAWEAIQTAWDALMTGISWAWDNVLKPVFDIIGSVAQALGIFLLVVVFGPIMLAWKAMTELMKLAWEYILKPVWEAIQVAAEWLWENVLSPIFTSIGDYWEDILNGISWAWENILKPVWNAIEVAAGWLFDNVLKPIFNGILWYWTTVLDGIGWAWEHVLKPVWNAVATAAEWLYENAIQPVFDGIRAAWDGLAQSFQWVYNNLLKPVFDWFGGLLTTLQDSFVTAVDWIGRTWDSLKDKLMAPVQWVIDFVWNDGLRGLWNTINNLWGGDDLQPYRITGGSTSPGSATGAGSSGNGSSTRLAQGGVMPGYTPGRDVHHFFSPTGGDLHLSGGEAVMRPEFTRAMGVHGVNMLNAAARTGGAKGVAQALAAANAVQSQSFANGGVLELPGWLDTALSVIPGTGFIADVISGINGGEGLGGGMFRDGLFGTIGKIGSEIWNAAKELFDGSATMSGKSFAATPNGANGLGPAAQRARDYVMGRWGISNIGGFARRNIAGTGTPSDHSTGHAIDVMIANYRSAAGIAQGTEIAEYFRTNPGAFGTKYVIWRDRIANGGAGWKPYRHPGGGGGDTLQHRDHVHASLYDDGGILPPGLHLTENRSGKPEAVFTADEFEVFRQIAANGGDNAPLVGQLTLVVDPNTSIHDQIGTVTHELRRLKRGGRV